MIFRIRLGRARDRAAHPNGRFRPLAKQVEAAIRRTGSNPNRIGGSAGKGAGVSTPVAGAPSCPSPRTAAGRRPGSAGRVRSRRVVVEARVGLAPAALLAMPRIFGPRTPRWGLSRAGGPPRVPLHRCAEDAARLGDLRDFTRDLMRQMEQDLETRLDWIAVDHPTPVIPTLTSSSAASSATARFSTSRATTPPMIGRAIWSPGSGPSERDRSRPQARQRGACRAADQLDKMLSTE
jgi:hypothetical protein